MMSDWLCRWFGHSIGRLSWRSANSVTVQCARCSHVEEMKRR